MSKFGEQQLGIRFSKSSGIYNLTYHTICIDIWKRKSTVWKQTRGLRLKVRIEKQSDSDKKHARFNIHEYEFTSIQLLGDEEIFQKKCTRCSEQTNKDTKLSPTIIYYSLPRIGLNNWRYRFNICFSYMSIHFY